MNQHEHHQLSQQHQHQLSQLHQHQLSSEANENWRSQRIQKKKFKLEPDKTKHDIQMKLFEKQMEVFNTQLEVLELEKKYWMAKLAQVEQE